MSNYVAYYRVSTPKQGIGGYGMAAQKERVRGFLAVIKASVTEEFYEVGSGKDDNRPELMKAIEACKKHNALLISSEMDRISRNVSFFRKLDVRHLGIDCFGLELPEVVKLIERAEWDQKQISQRTKAALAIAKSRGVVLGNPNPKSAWIAAQKVIQKNKLEFAKISLKKFQEIESTGVNTLNGIAGRMNILGEKTRHGGVWTGTTVKRIKELNI